MNVVDAGAIVDLIVGRVEPADVLSAPASAPHLIDSEVAHALRRLAARGELSEEQAALALDVYTTLEIERHAATGLLPRVWSLRHAVSAYDATYVALAETLGADALVTTDRRLAGAHGLRCAVKLV